MGDVIPNTRFRRSPRDRARYQARFARRRPWQLEHDRAMADFRRIISEGAPAKRSRRR